MLYNSQEPTFTPTPTPTPTTTSTPGFENKVLKEIYYNCTECNALIEILSIDEKENTIEFLCSNQHKKLMPIKEFLDKMMDNDNVDINKDICQIHKNKYMSFCFDCKKHLCKDCLKTRDHIYHNKNNIIEIQPIKTELEIIKKIVKYYDDKLEKLKNKKFLIKKRLNSFLDKCKTDIYNMKTKSIESSLDLYLEKIFYNEKQNLLLAFSRDHFYIFNPKDFSLKQTISRNHKIKVESKKSSEGGWSRWKKQEIPKRRLGHFKSALIISKNSFIILFKGDFRCLGEEYEKIIFSNTDGIKAINDENECYIDNKYEEYNFLILH